MSTNSKIKKGMTGEKNPFWKGGRSIASTGYMLVRVGMDHHLADVRGYAFEHRIVAEKAIGRRLRHGEIVHHIDGDKLNNAPSNLSVVDGAGEHFLLHRKRETLRHPWQANTLVLCRCGCGSVLLKFDLTGRPRYFVSGHNPHPMPTLDAIQAHLRTFGPSHREALVECTGISRHAVSVGLSKLKKKGLVINSGKGIWEVANGR